MARKKRVDAYQRLLFPLAEEDLRADVERRSGLRVRLQLTTNRSSMVRVSRAADGSARVRAHQVFLWAPKPVLRALGRFVRSPRSREAREVLAVFLRAEEERVLLCGREETAASESSGDGEAAHGAGARARLRTQGEHVDLATVFERINREHFGGRVRAAIGWGRARALGPRRSIHFGTFEGDDAGGVIRIHPAIDRDFVPAFFIDFVVFHEMLHATLPIERKNGRRVVHSEEFRAREQAYPDFARAKSWERSNLHRFLRDEGTGRVSRHHRLPTRS